MSVNDTVTTEDRYARAEGTVTRKVGGETGIVPVRANVARLDALYTLNETATFVWEQVDGTRTVADLIAAVVAEFAVPPGVAEEDVNRLLSELHDSGLLRFLSATTRP